MEKMYYYVLVFRKGLENRKGKLYKEIEYKTMSEAVQKLETMVFLHEDMFLYTIERRLKEENE